ncbi:MAG: hypothetical protein HQL50_08370 [Magnetococcales bacterium]|nr:hypothetical protein [Magnetococcales bacterium]
MSDTDQMREQLTILEEAFKRQETRVKQLERWKDETEYKLEQLSDRNSALLRQQGVMRREIEKEVLDRVKEGKKGKSAFSFSSRFGSASAASSKK